MKSIKKMKALLKPNPYLLVILILILLYLFIYFLYIYPITRIHTLQTKEWFSKLNDKLILGAKDKSLLYKVNNTEIDSLSLWYNYFYIHAEKYTICILFHLHNKFSTDMKLLMYIHNFEYNTNELHQVDLDFNDFQTSKQGDTLLITCNDSYYQEINMVTNKMKIIINIGITNINLDLYMEDYTTYTPQFTPRYYNIKNILNPYIPTTSTPNEWCSDNPITGKIINGTIDNNSVQEGVFWFDNMIGANDFFLTSYTWFVITNDNWMISKIWFGEYEKKEKTLCFMIKHRLTNKVLYTGFNDTVIPGIFKGMNNMLNPIKCNWTSNKKIGDDTYDSFSTYFETNDLCIKFNSIENKSNTVFSHDYYDSGYNTNIKNETDKKQYDVFKNQHYHQYLNMIDVEITYNGKTEISKERCIVDTFYVHDKTKPTTF